MKPKHINSTSSPTSIETLFFMPGIFHRLVVEMTSVNQSCSIEYSPIYSPFYSCLFKNLTSAYWFVLTSYVSSIDNDQLLSGDLAIVYTGIKYINYSQN